MHYSPIKGSHGLCVKNSKGNRHHVFSDKIDGADRKFKSCDMCGMMPVRLQNTKRLKYEDNTIKESRT